MTAETPEFRDRTKSDPDLATKFAILQREHQLEEAIQGPTIEEVGLSAVDDLNDLENSLDEEELSEEPRGDSVLLNIIHNDAFVTDLVLTPNIFALLERTGQAVFFTPLEMVGYAFAIPDYSKQENEDKEPGVGFVITDLQNNTLNLIDMPGDIQEQWDTSPKVIRRDLQVFAGLTKREIIGKFFDFAFEYANPGAEPIDHNLDC